MRHLLIGVITALAIGFVIPAPAEATPYTKSDMDFVASVTAMGYRDDEKDRLIKTGHVVCELLDEGANSATVKAEVTIRYSTGKEQHDDGGYWANLFIQSAAIAYCPWQPVADSNV